MKKNSQKILVVVIILILIICFLFSLIYGVEKISLIKIMKNIFTNNINLLETIFLQIRLPRTILVLLSGILLAGAGAVFQGFFRNPLAEPGVMGITSGATLGAVSSFLLPTFFSHFIIQPITLFAFLGALITGLCVYLLANRKTFSNNTISFILIGTALGTFFSSLTSIILLVKEKQLHSMYIWTLGSFSGKGWNEIIFLIIPTVISLILIFIASKKMDVLSCGEQTAQSLGLNLQKTRVLVLVTGSLATATAVCAGGTIGFIGLIAPHIARIILGPSYKKLIPVSMMIGAIVLIVSDILSRVILSPSEIPIGIITSLIGAPFFISIIATSGKNK